MLNYKKETKNLRKGEKGITLISLVVTIIVLLILSAIAMSMLTGENSVLKRATETKEATERGEIEEALRLAYMDLKSGDIVNRESNATLANAVTEVKKQGYKIAEKTPTGAQITGVTLSKTNVSFEQDAETKQEQITVILQTEENAGTKYYAEITGKLYEITENNGDITVSKTSTEVSGGSSEPEISVNIKNSSIASATVSGTTITITGTTTVGSTQFDVAVNGTTYENLGTIAVTPPKLKPGDKAQVAAVDNYEDSNGDKATVPVGFTISNVDGEKTISGGLVIRDDDSNEYVWIEVPRSIYTNATYTADIEGDKTITATDYDKIYKVLNRYAYDYREGKQGQGAYWVDEWYDVNGKTATDDGADLTNTGGCGLTSEQYTTLYQKMLKSVYENGGFYIGRYEAGDSGSSIVSKPHTNTKSNVTCSQAQILASNINSCDYNSSLMFGIQWDLVMKYLEVKGYLYDGTKITQSMLKSDSTSWGNYSDDTFSNTTGKSETGAFSETKANNIYDIAGNSREWTLEHATLGGNIFGPSCIRDGSYNLSGYYYPSSFRVGVSGALPAYRSSRHTLLTPSAKISPKILLFTLLIFPAKYGKVLV